MGAGVVFLIMLRIYCIEVCLEVSLEFFIELGVESLFFSPNTLVDFLLDKFIHIRVGEARFVGDGLGGSFSDGGDFFGVIRGFRNLVSFLFAEFEVV